MSRNGLNNKGGRPKGSFAQHTLVVQESKKRTIEILKEELTPVLLALTKKAKSGDIAAIKEFLERLLGKTRDDVQMDITTDGEQIVNLIPEVIAIAEEELKKRKVNDN